MICPNCSFDNLPGSETCARCHQDLTQLDVPIAQDRVQRSLMEDPVSVLGQHTPITVRPGPVIRCSASGKARPPINAAPEPI